MKKKTILKGTALLILILALLSLSTCDQWINIEVWIENYSGAMVDEMRLEDDDDNIIGIYSNVPDGAVRSFRLSVFDTDKYTKITAYVRVGLTTYHSSGNVAENDWITVIDFPSDF